uniref:Integrin alpha-2 domain-containing protein n=1 Tax=Esox lucius TaxID=8010 RepID=A0A6Q2ZQG4_ESOLU
YCMCLPLFSFLSLYFLTVAGFNLDTSMPLTKEGKKGSFFGFSLALHQQLTPEPKSWILVGAPRARGKGPMRNQHPGALYRCPITGEEFDCEHVDIDQDVNLGRESKDNQWLGVTVKSQGIGGKVVTCAHLYELRQRVGLASETRDPVGRCYVLSEDLTERDDLDGGEWKFCEGRPQGHEQFGSCQQGLSAAFTPDNQFIMFGAPGTYNWKGEMRVQLINKTQLDLGFYDDGPYEVADEKQLNAQLVPVPYHSYLGLLFMASPVEDALVYKTLEPHSNRPMFQDVAQNSYLGFSVDSAKGIMSRSELTFVAGAPRANHTGAVVLLRKDNVYRLVPQHLLWGEELASSFGYSVATADLNNDGWTDLIVGAPNYFDRKAEIGGAVYVFLNPFGNWEYARPIRLNGTYDSMFGLSVNNVGDLDKDGYDDIAVGAPFDGDGKVFIYRGTSSGIDTKPSQILDGVNEGVKRFGYSISGGMDMDGNLYPDLAVGSLGDKMVLYRSRPVIHVTRDILIEPQQYIDLNQHNCKDYPCGGVIELTAILPSPFFPFSLLLALVILFEADTERRKLGLPHRVSFLGRSAHGLEFTHTDEVELKGQRHPACQRATFQLHDNIRDKLRPISLVITHTIRPPIISPDTNRQERDTLPPILSVCLNPHQYNLKLTYQFGTRPPTSNLFTPLPKLDMAVFSLSDQRSVVLEVTITNMPSDPVNPEADGDDAHAAQLLVNLPDTLSYTGFRGQQVVCQANQNGSQAECELGNPLKRDATLKFYIILSTSAITIETTELTVNLLLNTISEQQGLVPVTAMAKVIIELPLAVSGLARPHQLFFSGAVKGESAMETLEDVGSAVELEFTVTNTGPSLQTLGSAFLNIMWPHELSNGKWLLYPTALHFQGHPGTQCTPHTALNPRRFSQRSPLEDKPQAAVLLNTNSAIFMAHPHLQDCLLGSAHCVLLQCPLHSFSGSAVLRIQGRLWNSTFLEEFPSVSALELLVRANITVKSSIKHLVLNDAVVPVMIYPEIGLTDQYWVPWWWILIAILAGILVLALLVCLMWKCGFFRRAQYKEKVPQYHAVKIPRQDRPQFQQSEHKAEILQKKEWATHWSDGTS